ncbi:hypothetical protein GCM10027321_21430 [Massilia terrae]|uniref:Transporter n=1 Tax=Massilia terrae TaxID=1811224 RepID=A0ABT2CYA3_9BURK|nr:hypothetical protein [Massilia terrae]MCS0658961.1 hypothetical protein [Massilia terrae]
MQKKILDMSIAALALAAGTAAAAPEEIQVYMNEMSKPGEFGLDVHTNYVLSGAREPDYPGAQLSRHSLRVTPEFSYGLSSSLELGAYILGSRDGDGRYNVGGEKLRLKFIPSAADSPLFYGANLEIGRVEHRFDENPWNGELKGILGYKGSRWTAALNVNVDFKVSGPAPAPTTIELASKFGYAISDTTQVGFESYNELGEARQLGNPGRQPHTTYAVLDTNVKGWDLNLGIGRGNRQASDRWVLKAIIGVPFN